MVRVIGGAVQRVVTEAAAHEIVEQLRALITGAPAAGFLAAHPQHSIYMETTGVNPGSRYGGTWRALPSIGPFAWERTDDGTSDGSVAQFLASHPVGCLYLSTSATSPSATYGGSWEERPSLGAHVWERKA
ncbi:MAG: hypothetical protein ACI38Z_05130 [Parafannyhessea sp.]|uniref:hypothetical protein n=1 Tax=Parafannyhessea sp. TaxID=2847324 RepID=UPI003EFC556D